MPPTAAEIRTWRHHLSAVVDDERRDELIAAISDIYDSEKERQARLEDKLNGQASLLAAVYPIAAAVVALALADNDLIPFALSFVAIAHLTLAFVVARFGVASAPRYGLQPENVMETIEENLYPAVAIAAIKAASAVGNRPHAIRTSNWIWCCQVSLVWSIVLTALAAILLLPRHFPGA